MVSSALILNRQPKINKSMLLCVFNFLPLAPEDHIHIHITSSARPLLQRSPSAKTKCGCSSQWSAELKNSTNVFVLRVCDHLCWIHVENKEAFIATHGTFISPPTVTPSHVFIHNISTNQQLTYLNGTSLEVTGCYQCSLYKIQ